MTTKKIFSTLPLPADVLSDTGADCVVSSWKGGVLSVEDFYREIADCHGLLCLPYTTLDRAALDAAPLLEFVATTSVGFDHIDVPALTARGIPLGNTPFVLEEATADMAFALLLAAARRVVRADRFIREGNWKPELGYAPTADFAGKDIHGATLGIVGLGGIGRAMARRAVGFGMRVLAWNRSKRSVPGVELVSLEELLPVCDYVSLHVALTAETYHLLNAERIASMKPGAILINTARGDVIDETALIEALSSGQLEAAGLDVFAEEPLRADNPLLGLANVVLTPHIGAASRHTHKRILDLTLKNLRAGLAGEPMPACVNPEVYL